MSGAIAPAVGIAYAKTVAEAMNLKVDTDSLAHREKFCRTVLDLVAQSKGRISGENLRDN
jgi:hypothetical protein